MTDDNLDDNLAPDLQVIPGLVYEESHFVGDLPSPTASMRAPTKSPHEYLVVGHNQTVRDSRPIEELIREWIAALNRAGAKAKLGNYTAELSDFLAFKGDENGIGAAYFEPYLVKGIIKL